MKRDQYDWIESVLTSMEGSQRARPNVDLFDRIEGELYPESKVIPINQWRSIAAAAAILIALNVYGYFHISGYHRSSADLSQRNTSQDLLISNYNLYE